MAGSVCVNDGVAVSLISVSVSCSPGIDHILTRSGLDQDHNSEDIAYVSL